MLIESMNEAFGDSCLIAVKTDKYIKIDCKYNKCVFSHWYNFNDGLKNIKWFRGINQSHVIQAHKDQEISNKQPL